MREIIKEDIENLVSKDTSFPWSDLKDKTILITGGTGLIGSLLVQTLLFASEKYKLGIKVVVLVRDIEKAKNRLNYSNENNLVFLVTDIESFSGYNGDVDYIIHAAYPTSSAFFMEHPVETIKTGILGTINMLDFAIKKQVKRFLFVSSMEIYGTINDERLLNENQLGYINLYSSRSCYPESKRMCENIVSCYTKEYSLNASCIRLAQTFGPGVPSDDRRVFAMMARCAINCEDIILNTTGQSKHPYLYNIEAVSAILTVLLKGTSNCCYNASNPDTYCSIYEMAELVANKIASGTISVKLDLKDTSELYPPASYLNLDVTSINGLGWRANVNLEEMFIRMIDYMKESNNQYKG